MIGQLFTKQLSHEVDLVQVASTPRANDQMQLELQLLAEAEWTVHRLGHHRDHVAARFERAQQQSSE